MVSVEDQIALERLHSLFVHAADRRDYALLRSLYADDAIDDHGLFNGPVDGYVDWLREVQDAFQITTHVLTNVIAAIEGEEAQSEARGTAYLTMKADPNYNMIVINRHFDTYRRIDGRWLFTHRSLCIDWVQVFPPSTESLDIVRANPLGTMGPGDIVYQRAPMVIEALRRSIARPDRRQPD